MASQHLDQSFGPETNQDEIYDNQDPTVEIAWPLSHRSGSSPIIPPESESSHNDS